MWDEGVVQVEEKQFVVLDWQAGDSGVVPARTLAMEKACEFEPDKERAPLPCHCHLQVRTSLVAGV